MKYLKQKRGFTLIEILVVVVIIGILGAIALPQYQRAVLRSKYASLMPIAKSMADGNEAYFLEHGEYADNAQDLPIQGRQNYPNGTELEFGTSSDYSYVLATNQNGTPNNVYVTYQKHSKNFPGNIHCEAADDDELATWLCRDALHGTPVNTGEIKSLSGEGYTAYVLSGSTSGSTFDRSCEGEPETITQPCPGGCGVMSATPTCNPYTGEWEAQDLDPSSCPTQPEPEVASCSSGDGTKTRTASCNSDGTAYEWGQWDESACCTGTPSTTGRTLSNGGVNACSTASCSGSTTGTEPVCVNGQWQWESFSGNVQCSGGGASCTNPSCTSTTEGGINGGSCTGTYQNASCNGSRKYGCTNSTFSTKAGKYASNTASCNATAEYGCANSTFYKESPTATYSGTVYCAGNSAYGCAGSTFTGAESGNGSPVRCEGRTAYGCADSTFTTRSVCYGQTADACKGSTFKSLAVCRADAPGACDGVIYDGGCCHSTSGYCPAGSPKCNMPSGWDAPTGISGTW